MPPLLLFQKRAESHSRTQSGSLEIFANDGKNRPKRRMSSGRGGQKKGKTGQGSTSSQSQYGVVKPVVKAREGEARQGRYQQGTRHAARFSKMSQPYQAPAVVSASLCGVDVLGPPSGAPCRVAAGNGTVEASVAPGARLCLPGRALEIFHVALGGEMGKLGTRRDPLLTASMGPRGWSDGLRCSLPVFLVVFAACCLEIRFTSMTCRRKRAPLGSRDAQTSVASCAV